MSAKSVARERDRDTTRQRILDAAAKVLSDDGFAAFGVNAVSREAGCDKVLIYRYFGGLEGLAEALGARLDVWLGPLPQPTGIRGYGAVMAAVLGEYLKALRGNPLLKRILAWELQDTNELTRQLGRAKSLAVTQWFIGVRAQSGPPPEMVDAPAINAILIAAAHHLALREAHDGTFAGLDLTLPQTWPRIEAAMNLLLARAYQSPSSEGSKHNET